MDRKPSGFWTKDEAVKHVMGEYVRGEASLDEATDLLAAYCAELGVTQPREAIKADVVWYARATRKALGIPSVRQAAQIAIAKQEIAKQG